MTEDFIRRYELDHLTCDELVNYFWSNKDKHTDTKRVKGKQSKDVYVDLYAMKDIPCVARYDEHLAQSLRNYCDTFPILYKASPFAVMETLNIQWYDKGWGFKNYHAERTGALDYSIKRILVFMTYLNTVPDGGTDFKHYNHTETAVKGKTLIWPSDWTHTHRSQISNTQEKIIITGWVSHQWDFF